MIPALKVSFGIGRFFATIPAIYWASRAIPLYRGLTKRQLPIGINLRKEIYRSQGISSVLSVLLILWMFPIAIWVLRCNKQKRRRWLMLYCTIDWIMIGLLIGSLYWQSQYLPWAWKTCNNAAAWDIGDDTKLFGLTASKDICFEASGNKCTATRSCNNFMEASIPSLVVLIMDGFTAIYPVLVIPIPWQIVKLFGQLQSLSKISLQRYRKSGLSSKNTRNVRYKPDENYEVQEWRLKRKAALIDIFNGDESSLTILSLAKLLHYSDIISLASTSKAMHEAIYRSNPSSQKIRNMRLRACENSKSECWSCGIQICESCNRVLSLREPASKTHLDNCSPYCSECYYKHLCPRALHGPLPPLHSAPSVSSACVCRTTPKVTSIYFRDPAMKTRRICRFCHALGTKRAVEVREAREKAELKHLVGQQLRCSVCSRGMHKRGLRWWGCSLCKTECTSHFHPAWKEDSIS